MIAIILFQNLIERILKVIIILTGFRQAVEPSTLIPEQPHSRHNASSAARILIRLTALPPFCIHVNIL